MICSKILKTWNVERANLSELHSSYFQTANQLKSEGVSKLRARNDKIHAELEDLAIENNVKLTSFKKDGMVYYLIPRLNISVALVNK